MLLLIYNTSVSGASEIKPEFVQTILESINSISRYDMVRQTVPDGYYPVSEVKFSQIIVTVMLNQFIFITSNEILWQFHKVKQQTTCIYMDITINSETNNTVWWHLGTNTTPNNHTNIFQGVGTRLHLTPGFNQKNPRNSTQSKNRRFSRTLQTTDGRAITYSERERDFTFAISGIFRNLVMEEEKWESGDTPPPDAENWRVSAHMYDLYSALSWSHL